MKADLTKAVRSKDPTIGLRAVAALRELADELEPLHVRKARAEGLSWEAIGIRLHISKQALHKKYAHHGWGATS